MRRMIPYEVETVKRGVMNRDRGRGINEDSNDGPETPIELLVPRVL